MVYAAARVTASAGNIPGRVLIFGKSCVGDSFQLFFWDVICKAYVVVHLWVDEQSFLSVW